MVRYLLLITILSLLLQASFCIHLANEENDDQKVKVDFYYQTICPHSKAFILGPLKEAAQTKDFWKICQLNLYPWGNANRRKRGDSWEIICQHGPGECEGNIIQTCALKLYEKYSQVIPFVICMEQGSPFWENSGKSCAAKYGLDWKKIKDCSVSQEGFKQEMKMGDATESLNPPRTEAPWFVVDGKHTATTNEELQDGLVQYVCKHYKGSIKIEACK